MPASGTTARPAGCHERYIQRLAASTTNVSTTSRESSPPQKAPSEARPIQAPAISTTESTANRFTQCQNRFRTSSRRPASSSLEVKCASVFCMASIGVLVTSTRPCMAINAPYSAFGRVRPITMWNTALSSAPAKVATTMMVPCRNSPASSWPKKGIFIGFQAPVRSRARAAGRIDPQPSAAGNTAGAAGRWPAASGTTRVRSGAWSR